MKYLFITLIVSLGFIIGGSTYNYLDGLADDCNAYNQLKMAGYNLVLVDYHVSGNFVVIESKISEGGAYLQTATYQCQIIFH